MRHVILTCRNHPDLRWSTKEIAVRSDPVPGQPAGYNGTRNLYYSGRPSGRGMYSDGSGLDCTADVPECQCPAGDLLIAPEDAQVTR